MKERSSPNPRQATPSDSTAKSPGRDLQQLLDAIGSGAIADVDELQEHELELLRAYAHDDESVQALLDRLRAADPGEA
jgi:hypothetical protein